MSKIGLASITELIQPSLRQCGVELVDAQWGSAGGDGVLRLMIDTEEGVTLSDCERVSHAVGAVLDAFDPIAGNYRLEVSSPGAERPLREPEEWRKAVGRRVNVRFQSGEAEMVIEGRLLAVGDDAVELQTRIGRGPRTRVVTVPVADLLAGRIVVDI